MSWESEIDKYQLEVNKISHESMEIQLKIGHRSKLIQSQITNMQTKIQSIINKICRKHGVNEG